MGEAEAQRCRRIPEWKEEGTSTQSVQDEIAIKSFVNEAEDSTRNKQGECNDHLESQLLLLLTTFLMGKHLRV